MRYAPLIDCRKLLDTLPGWVCLLGGAVLLALFIWTPQWLACRETGWQRDLMRAQAAALTEQRDRYAQFLAALEADDPVVIERLAFTELRRKRVGQQFHGTGDDVLLASNTQFIPDDPSADAHGFELSALSSTMPGSVHDWLEVPMPVVGRDIQPLAPVESHLTRIVAGPFRILAVVFAVGVMLMGVLLQVRQPNATRRVMTACPVYRLSRNALGLWPV